ncbi:hypothetical protein [Deinococcus sp.]|uniref:hypothetical protein n=1 Tax=Deinococcus sp. TaxID=47478 RepID=UPI0025BAE8EA|nr:hypothetical protein [Deinococcus sp.]
MNRDDPADQITRPHVPATGGQLLGDLATHVDVGDGLVLRFSGTPFCAGAAPVISVLRLLEMRISMRSP